MRQYSNDTHHRVSKDIARNYYKAGAEVSVLPCKVRFDNSWIVPCILPLDQDFDKLVNEYEYYNCNRELGTYSAFYINRTKRSNYNET